MSTATATEPRAAASSRGAGLPRGAQGAIGVLVLVVVLELLSRTGVVPTTLLPSPAQVLVQLGVLLTSPAFLADVASTLAAWAIGLGLASVVGVTAGLVLGSSRWAYEASSALIEFLRPIPAVALVPLAILMFGTSTTMKWLFTEESG